MLIKYFRENKNLTQNEVAKKLHISVRHYQRIESGKSFPRENVMVLLEDLFHVPCRVLLSKSIDEVPNFLQYFLP